MTFRAECISCKCDHSLNGSSYLTHSQITSRRSNLEKTIQREYPFVLLTRVTCTSAHATRQMANPVVRTSHTTTFEFSIRTRKIVKNFLYSLITQQIHTRKNSYSLIEKFSYSLIERRSYSLITTPPCNI